MLDLTRGLSICQSLKKIQRYIIIVTDLLRAVIAESQRPAIARELHGKRDGTIKWELVAKQWLSKHIHC
jgi:hypothetical protein